MKLSRRDQYRRRHNPLFLPAVLLGVFVLLLLVFFWWRGGGQPVGEIEIDVPAANLAG